MEELADEDEFSEVDCKGLTLEAIHEKMRGLDAGGQFRLANLPTRLDGLGSGIDLDGHVKLTGNVGDFAFMAAANTDWDVSGNAGNACCHSNVSSRVLIRGSATNYLGACAVGGFVVVHGLAKDRCGYGMTGGDMLIRGKVGNEAGCRLRGGVVVLANGAGQGLGIGMTGGTIFVRGEVKSIADTVRAVRLKDPDSLRLSLLLARAGVKGDVKEFKMYRTRLT